MVQTIINGIGLIAVRNNCLIAEHADRSIDDKTRILHLRRIKGLGADAVPIGNEHAVSAVLAPAHDEIRNDSLTAVAGASHQDSASRIASFLQSFFQICHVLCPP